MISYKPLWDTLKSKEVTQYQLIHTYGISAVVLCQDLVQVKMRFSSS